MGKSLLHSTAYLLALYFFMACSQGKSNKSKASSEENEHTYHITIHGGQTYSGQVPKSQAGIFWPFSIVSYSEEVNSKVLAGTLMDAGKFQVGIGLKLNENNRPILEGDGPGLVFGEWNSQQKYTPVGSPKMTLKNYQEHNISFAGEKGVGASYTLEFQGTFKANGTEETVEVSGKITSAAP